MAFVRATADSGTTPRLLLDPATPLLVLDGDPLAGEPGTERVPDRDRLRAALLDWAHDAFAPVVETASRLSRRGRRALWQTVADRLGNGFLLAGRAGGDLPAARAEFESTLAGAAVRSLRVRPDWVEVPNGGTVELFRRRSVCCLYYTSRVHGEQYCATCPLLPREETLARLRDTVAQQDDGAPHAGSGQPRAGAPAVAPAPSSAAESAEGAPPPAAAPGPLPATVVTPPSSGVSASSRSRRPSCPATRTGTVT
nr:(2Fe-2S)-binding protein [Pseudonocardia sp. C8]